MEEAPSSGFDVVDQHERNGVEVDRITGKANRRQTTSVLQDQSFLSEKTAQVNFHAAVTAVDDVFIDCRSRSGWQLLDKVSGERTPSRVISSLR